MQSGTGVDRIERSKSTDNSDYLFRIDFTVYRGRSTLATRRGGGHLEGIFMSHQYDIGQAIRMGSKERSRIDSCSPDENKLDGAIGDASQL
jgi:hypothetical protein